MKPKKSDRINMDIWFGFVNFNVTSLKMFFRTQTLPPSIPIKHGQGSLSCPWWWDHSFTKTAGCWMNRRKYHESWVVVLPSKKSRDILWSFCPFSRKKGRIFTDVENEYVFLNRTMLPLEARESSEKLKRFQVGDPNCWPYWDDTSDTLFSS